MIFISRSQARDWHERMAFPPVLLCEDIQKATKGKALAGDCRFSGCIQFKMWSPTLSPATPFCCLVWTGFPWSPEEMPEGSATVPSSERGRKYQQNHMNLHLKAHSHIEIASIFYFIFYKKGVRQEGSFQSPLTIMESSNSSLASAFSFHMHLPFSRCHSHCLESASIAPLTRRTYSSPHSCCAR